MQRDGNFIVYMLVYSKLVLSYLMTNLYLEPIVLYILVKFVLLELVSSLINIMFICNA